jgi:hypothetical protein
MFEKETRIKGDGANKPIMNLQKRELIKSIKNILRTKRAFMELMKLRCVSFCLYYCDN